MSGKSGKVGAVWRARAGFTLGCLLGLAGLTGLAEAYLRCFPPTEAQDYQGEASPATGPFVPDSAFGVRYRSWEAFHAANAERLAGFGPLHPSPGGLPVWAFFGNSFVQAPGMLGDTARQQLADRRIFYLGRNELFFVRLAQVRLLLEQGLAPERLFFVLMPVDLIPLGQQPRDTVQVTSRGALTYRPRWPTGPAGRLVQESALARLAWFRAGRQRGNPSFDPRTLYDRIDEPLWDDLCHYCGQLAEVTRRYGVPATFILIPTYHQVLHGETWAFQDRLGAMLRERGFDVLDPRTAFCSSPDPHGLYLPDKHLTAAGNQLLLAELLAHVRSRELLAGTGRGETAP